MLDQEQFTFDFPAVLSHARDLIIVHGPKGGDALQLWPEHQRVAHQLEVLSVAAEEQLDDGWIVNNFSHLLADTHAILTQMAKRVAGLDQGDLAIIDAVQQVHAELPAAKPSKGIQAEIAQSQAGRLGAESVAQLTGEPPFPYLEFGTPYQVAGDPQTAAEFARARNYLEVITSRLSDACPWQEMSSADIVDELECQNAWGADVARRQGVAYQEVTLQQLRALSRRRMLMLEETSPLDLDTYQTARQVDALIDQAIAAESTALPQQILEAITAALSEDGALLAKNSDDLRYELEFQNDQAFEDGSASAAVTLGQLLQASTAKIKVGGAQPAQIYVHQLLEGAFIEQTVLGVIETLWPSTKSTTLTAKHLPMLEAALRGHLSEHGLAILHKLCEQVQQQSATIAALSSVPLSDRAAQVGLQALPGLGNESRSTRPRTLVTPA